MPFIENAAGAALNTGLGMMLGRWNDERQLRQQGNLQRLQIKGQKEMADYGYGLQMKMWDATNYAAQMQQIKKAGLNPGLLYGMSGGGATTTGSQGGNVQGASAPAGGREIQDMIGMGIQARAQTELLQAQKRNIDADTENKLADTTGKGIQQQGMLTDNEIKTIDKMMREIDKTMKEMDYTDYYEPETYIDEEGTRWYTEDNKTRQSRREAAKATFEKQKAEANLYVKLWQDGTLQKMTQAELDNKLEEIGVKKGTIDKIKLENALTEMEKKWQEKMGMGKDSKGWIDTAGNILMRILLHFTRGAGTAK